MKLLKWLLGVLGALCVSYGVPAMFIHSGAEGFMTYLIISLVGVFLLLVLVGIVVLQKGNDRPKQ